ncbi:MAG TPA: FAD-dependent oxidoreductase [Anaeromyxobacteraceae bacterium]|nr:FAD-dependent oxidoreductase [Anaeromyxobacteraceae bacterium]
MRASSSVIVQPPLNPAPPPSDVLVLGAGLAGLSAALHLGQRYRLLERADRPGGLCRTDSRGGFLFDATGHWLHLRDPEARHLADELLPGGWLTIARRAGVFSHGVFTPYPYQVNTRGLPPEVVLENVLGFVEAQFGEGGRALRERGPRTFAEFVLRHLGSGFARNFMFPYNSKLWLVPLEELDCGPLERFVPRPSLADVVAGAVGAPRGEVGYNATFLYPREGGMEAFARALAARLPRPAECGVRPLAIDPLRRVARLSTGEEVRWRAIVSTIPLPDLARLVDGAPPRVEEAAAALRSNAVTYVNVAARESRGPPFHWVYLPEPRFRPYRVGSASTAVPGLAPPGCRSFWVEFSAPEPLPASEVEPAALSTLLELGFLGSRDDVLHAETRSIPHAYVICDRSWAEARATVIGWLEERDILVAGRYGRWEYSSMEDALLAGREVARRLA